MLLLQPTVPLLSALPAAPVDGQVICYQADATNGIVWQFRYRSASASAYKWEFIGGPPIFNAVEAEQGLAVTYSTMQDLATSGPALTAPVGGEYLASVALYGVNNAAATNILQVGLKINAGAVDTGLVAGGISSLVTGAGTYQTIGVPGFRVVGLVAGDVIKMQYKSLSNLAGAFGVRRLGLTPVRVG